MTFVFDDLFKGFNFVDGRTPEQKACGHILSSQMHDGKFFCPSCRLISNTQLVKPRGSK